MPRPLTRARAPFAVSVMACGTGGSAIDAGDARAPADATRDARPRSPEASPHADARLADARSPEGSAPSDATAVDDATPDSPAMDDAASRPAPTGVFCSCPATTPDGGHSVLPAVAALPWVQGILVRVAWSDLEPTRGSYNFGFLDAEIQSAVTAGKKVALGVVLKAPAWVVADGGAQSVTFQSTEAKTGVTSTITTPVPWDDFFLTGWTRAITALGEHLQGAGNYDSIAVVHMTSSSLNGFEMELTSGNNPSGPAAWADAGYTTVKEVGSWKKVIAAFAAGFPSVPLDVDLHPVLGDDGGVATEVVASGTAACGSRFGPFAAWYTAENAASPAYQSVGALLAAGCTPSFCDVQLAASDIRTPSAYGDGGLVPTFQAGTGIGVRYFEVWNDDLLGKTTADASAALAAQLEAGSL